MDANIRDTDVSLDEALKRTVARIEKETITLGELLELVGEQGLLIFCIIINIPFLFPVSIPGISTAFGAVIILIGISVTLNRLPWLPTRLLGRKLQRDQLLPVFERGISFVQRLQRFIRPRLTGLTEGAIMNRVNGVALTVAAVLLILPLSLIPFSNTLPAVAIMLLSIGMLQRDGVFVLAGYLFIALSILYFGGLALAAILGGQALLFN